nr:hypothetical protein GCM10025732_01810 [Glycomyces mayteni]
MSDPEIELALAAGTHGGAAVLGLDGYGLAVGCNADLFAVTASAPAEAVVSVPTRKLVVKRGAVVARDGVLAA